VNIIFLAIVLIAFLVAAIRQIAWDGLGDGIDQSPMELLGAGMVKAAEGSVTLAIGLIGVMALFLGLMKVAEAGGLLTIVARLLRPLMVRLFPEVPADWLDTALAAKWEIVRDVRRVVTGALELERAQKRIGSSLQAHPTVHVSDAALAAYEGLDAAEIFITSGAILTTDPAPAEAFRLPDVAGVAAVPGLAEGEKCERCWRQLPEVGHVQGHEAVCQRCADAVETIQGAAA
jgi:hypothetical protein